MCRPSSAASSTSRPEASKRSRNRDCNDADVPFVLAVAALADDDDDAIASTATAGEEDGRLPLLLLLLLVEMKPPFKKGHPRPSLTAGGCGGAKPMREPTGAAVASAAEDDAKGDNATIPSEADDDDAKGSRSAREENDADLGAAEAEAEAAAVPSRAFCGVVSACHTPCDASSIKAEEAAEAATAAVATADAENSRAPSCCCC